MFEQIAANLPTKICQKFRLALDHGCWGNGVRLTQEQRRICEQALFISDNTSNDTGIYNKYQTDKLVRRA